MRIDLSNGEAEQISEHVDRRRARSPFGQRSRRAPLPRWAGFWGSWAGDPFSLSACGAGGDGECQRISTDLNGSVSFDTTTTTV